MHSSLIIFEKRDEFCIAQKFSDEFFPLIGHAEVGSSPRALDSLSGTPDPDSHPFQDTIIGGHRYRRSTYDEAYNSSIKKLNIARPGKVEISTLAGLMSRVRRSNYSSAHQTI